VRQDVRVSVGDLDRSLAPIDSGDLLRLAKLAADAEGELFLRIREAPAGTPAVRPRAASAASLKLPSGPAGPPQSDPW
jgi:hypothetical protein